MNANLVSLLAFGGVASVSGAVLLAFRDLCRRPEAHSTLAAQLPRLPAEAPRSWLARFDWWFQRTVIMSGLDVTPTAAVLMAVLIGLVASGAAFLAVGEHLLVPVAGLAGVMAAIAALVIYKRRRMNQFERVFPGALDLLARAVRAGESLDQAISLVASSASEPVATEFQRCARHLEMGISMAAAMRALAQRVDSMDVRIFSNTLAAHRASGGNLALTLERLAQVIRDRQQYRRHLKSVTGAGRFSIYLIASLGPILFVYLFLFQPEYGHPLWENPLGRILLTAAVVSQIIGLAWVSRLLKPVY